MGKRKEARGASPRRGVVGTAVLGQAARLLWEARGEAMWEGIHWTYEYAIDPGEPPVAVVTQVPWRREESLVATLTRLETKRREGD